MHSSGTKFPNDPSDPHNQYCSKPEERGGKPNNNRQTTDLIFQPKQDQNNPSIIIITITLLVEIGYGPLFQSNNSESIPLQPTI